MERIVTTPLVNTAALGESFLELAATVPSAAVQTATTPRRTSATVGASYESVTPAATTPPVTSAVTVTWFPDWVGLLPVAVHATVTAH